MRHFAAPSLWEAYTKLPENIRVLADKSYALLKENPRHPSLQLKRIGRFWSVRVGSRYRALAVEGRRRSTVVLDQFSRRLRGDHLIETARQGVGVQRNDFRHGIWASARFARRSTSPGGAN